MKYLYNINLFFFYLLFLFSFNYISPNKYLKLPLSIIDFPSKEELSSISVNNLLIKLSKSRIQTSITIGSNRQILPCDISFEHYPLYVSSILCEENIIRFNQDASRTFMNYDKIDGYNINQNCLKCNTSKDIFYFNHDNINEAVPLFFILGSLKKESNFSKVSGSLTNSCILLIALKAIFLLCEELEYTSFNKALIIINF